MTNKNLMDSRIFRRQIFLITLNSGCDPLSSWYWQITQMALNTSHFVIVNVVTKALCRNFALKFLSFALNNSACLPLVLGLLNLRTSAGSLEFGVLLRTAAVLYSRLLVYPLSAMTRLPSGIIIVFKP